MFGAVGTGQVEEKAPDVAEEQLWHSIHLPTLPFLLLQLLMLLSLAEVLVKGMGQRLALKKAEEEARLPPYQLLKPPPPTTLAPPFPPSQSRRAYR